MLKKTTALEQLGASHHVRGWRHLMGLTQEQFAAVLSVIYTAVNEWENARMQASPLVLKQMKAMLKAMNFSVGRAPSEPYHWLLARYFSEASSNL